MFKYAAKIGRAQSAIVNNLLNTVNDLLKMHFFDLSL